MVQITTATQRLLQLKKKIRAVSGGTGASKTFSIMMILIDYAQSVKGEQIDIVSETYPHLEAGVMTDFKTIMTERNYWRDENWEKQPKIYTFETGTKIKFMSVDKLGKAHGPRRDILFLNEANYMPYNIADQLITRTRKTVWMDWNPSEDFWFYEEMLNKRDDIDFVGEGGNYPPLTYLDNEGLSDAERYEIESRRHNVNWWRVYGEGLRGAIEGRIYVDWDRIDEIPKGARLERRWLDFGYSNDPSAIGSVYYFQGRWLFDEELYRKGMSNKQLADFLLSMPRNETTIIADSAEPKSIDEIRAYGLNVLPSKKGKDSVTSGIQLVQDQPISYTSRSLNLEKEYRNYLWIVDKNGKMLNTPDPLCEDHHMDGIRYALSTLGRLKQEVPFHDRIWEEELSPQVKYVNPGR